MQEIQRIGIKLGAGINKTPTLRPAKSHKANFKKTKQCESQIEMEDKAI